MDTDYYPWQQEVAHMVVSANAFFWVHTPLLTTPKSN